MKDLQDKIKLLQSRIEELEKQRDILLDSTQLLLNVKLNQEDFWQILKKVKFIEKNTIKDTGILLPEHFGFYEH